MTTSHFEAKRPTLADSEKIDQVHKLTIYPEYFGGFTKGYMAALDSGGCPIYQDFMLEGNVAPLLTTISVLDLQETGIARYRYCGSHVVDQTGMDLTGQNLLDLVPKEGRDDLLTDMTAMITHPCGNFSQHLDLYASGKNVRSESLSLPLRSKAAASPGLLMTLHASEWTFLPDAQKQGLLGGGDVRIGAEWTKSVFVDLMYGTPGPTALQRNQPGIKQ